MSELSKAPKPNAATRDLWQIAVIGDADQLESLLTRNAAINEVNAAGFTALMLAAYHGHRTMAEALIKHGADVNAGSGSITALKLAEDAGHHEMATLLIEQGAQRNQKRARAKTPVRVGRNPCGRYSGNRCVTDKNGGRDSGARHDARCGTAGPNASRTAGDLGHRSRNSFAF
jgi:hypothetical protein